MSQYFFFHLFFFYIMKTSIISTFNIGEFKRGITPIFFFLAPRARRDRCPLLRTLLLNISLPFHANKKRGGEEEEDDTNSGNQNPPWEDGGGWKNIYMLVVYTVDSTYLCTLLGGKLPECFLISEALVLKKLLLSVEHPSLPDIPLTSSIATRSKHIMATSSFFLSHLRYINQKHNCHLCWRRKKKRQS